MPASLRPKLVVRSAVAARAAPVSPLTVRIVAAGWLLCAIAALATLALRSPWLATLCRS